MGLWHHAFKVCNICNACTLKGSACACNAVSTLPAAKELDQLQKKKLLLLTAAFRVSAEFLVGEFWHLPPSFTGHQQKPHRKSKKEFASHVSL